MGDFEIFCDPCPSPIAAKLLYGNDTITFDNDMANLGQEITKPPQFNKENR